MNTAPQHRLIYIRHGETEWSRLGKHTGAADIALTSVGEDQARALAPLVAGLALDSPTVWVSPRSRAAHTARLAGLDVSAVRPDLAEWDYGDYEGRTSAQIRTEVADWSVWDGEMPGGESLTEVTTRADRLLVDVVAAMADGDVVLVGHGHFGRVLTARFLDSDARFGRHLPLLPASVAVGSFDHDAVPQLRQFGLTGYDCVTYDGR